MPAPHPPEFRQRAVELARLREKPISHIAKDRGISVSCLRNWLAQADLNDGARLGLSSDERAELIQLRRDNRIQAIENRHSEAGFGPIPLGRTCTQNGLPVGP